MPTSLSDPECICDVCRDDCRVHGGLPLSRARLFQSVCAMELATNTGFEMVHSAPECADGHVLGLVIRVETDADLVALKLAVQAAMKYIWAK